MSDCGDPEQDLAREREQRDEYFAQPRPYYQDDRVTLYHGDCLEVSTQQRRDRMVVRPTPEQRAEMAAYIDATSPGLLDDLGIVRNALDEAQISPDDPDSELWIPPEVRE